MTEACKNFLLRQIYESNRLIEIPFFLEDNSLDINALKALKEEIIDIATSVPHIFLYAGALYYLKVIDSIETTDLAINYSAIPEYLKIIKIMQYIVKRRKLPSVYFDDFLFIIKNSIYSILAAPESVELFLGFLKTMKKFKTYFEVLNIDKNLIESRILEFINREESFEKAYSIIEKAAKISELSFLDSKNAWVNKAISWLSSIENCRQAIEKNSIKNCFTILWHFKNDLNFWNKSMKNYCKTFEINSNEIIISNKPISQKIRIPKDSFFSNNFSFVFESHFIGHKNQIKFEKVLRSGKPNVSIIICTCLLNLKKVCAKIYQGNDEKFVQNYKKEVEISRTLSKKSPIFLNHLGDFDDDEKHYFIMELCKEVLSSLIENEVRFSNADVAYFAHLFIQGLTQLKDKFRLYHRDIKPDNIGITFSGEFKLIDFDIADIITEDSEEEILNNLLPKGTYYYLSPEIFHIREVWALTGSYSRELADVYSLGLVILKMHTETVLGWCRTDRSYLDEKIENIKLEVPWLWRLLKSMLCENFNDRLRFKSLLDMIENDIEFLADKDSYNKDWRSQ